MALTKLKPGVVTGADYMTLVKACKDGKYALPAVNVTGTNTINAVLEAASKNRADVIIQLSNGGAEFYAGKGMPDSFQAKVLGAVSAARHVHILAEHYGVCVVLHTDHANKALIPWVEAMLDHGEAFFKETGKPLFTSHMLDLSEDDIEFNLSESARLLKRMAKIGMSIKVKDTQIFILFAVSFNCAQRHTMIATQNKNRAALIELFFGFRVNPFVQFPCCCIHLF